MSVRRINSYFAFCAFFFSYFLWMGSVPVWGVKTFPLDQFSFYISNYTQRLSEVSKISPSELDKVYQNLRFNEETKNYRQAALALEQILKIRPKEPALWISLARNLSLGKPLDTQDTYALPTLLIGAALKAYDLSTLPQEQAEALKLAAQGLERREAWREALIAYKESLKLSNDPVIQKHYEELNEQYGFRITNYTVDSDVTPPRACFQFADPVSKTVTDFLPYFKQDPGPVSSVTVDGSRLCVDALKHGERYKILVRGGLPSAVGDVLSRDFEYEFYVKDIKPTVRFVSKSYILPRIGQNGIPFVSVNSKSANLALYKIGDRNLLASVLNSDFRSQIYSYTEQELSERLGSLVWKGTIETPSLLNEEKTFAFPVFEALGNVPSGLYVLTAKSEGLADETKEVATQWFVVSDIGLATTQGKDGLHVNVRSLSNAGPLNDIEVRLIARNNEILGTERSTSEGYVDFSSGLLKGEGGLAPALLVAKSQKDDYSFLDLTQQAFDLSDRGVTGRAAPGKVDAFVYAERGVYRRGETVHAAVLLRDEKALALPPVPLFLVLERPDGIALSKVTLTDVGAGSYAHDFTINPSALGGRWSLKAYTDPKSEPVGQTSFLVEDYIPDTLEFEVTNKSKEVISKKGQALNFAIDGRYLFGAPAAGLDIEAELTVSANATPFEKWKDYYFGLMDERVDPILTLIKDLPKTDISGKADVSPSLPELPSATKPLKLDIAFRLRDPGGRAVEKSLNVPLLPSQPLLGIKPDFDMLSAPEGQSAGFEILALTPEGQPTSVPIASWTLLRLDTRYQWFNSDGYWKWESVTRTTKIANGVLNISGAPAKLTQPLEWGEYRLELSANGFTPASIDFSAGFYSLSKSKAETPDTLKIALDKTDVKPGETITLKIESQIAGSLNLQIVGDRQFLAKSLDVPKEGLTVPITVGSDWGTGAYVLASFYRPLDVKAKRMPTRSIGVAWFGIDRAAHELTLKLAPQEKIKPRGPLTVPVKVEGLSSGEEAFLTVAAVDVGILNLTNYKPPAPDKFYFDQKKLSADIRDVYGFLVDGMQGEVGKVRSGGDEGAGISGPPPTQAPLSLFSGIVKVGPDGAATLKFDLPSFNGTVRLMAVAWTKSKVGHASTDVLIRDPLVITASHPRFLAVGDTSRLRFDFINAEAPEGAYQFKLETEGPVEVSRAGAFQKIAMGPAGDRKNLAFPVVAKGTGEATFTGTLTGPNGMEISQSYSLKILPTNPMTSEQSLVELSARGGAIELQKDLVAGMVPGTSSVALSVNPLPALDAAGLLQNLERYPYGCSEQLVSRALALLYLDELKLNPKSLDGTVKEKLASTINILLNRQTGSGSFGLWSSYEDEISLWLTSFVADFLLRAREKGYEVPETSLLTALDYLRNSVGNSPDVKNGTGDGLAYALYVLARAGKAPVGDLKYLIDSRIDMFGTSLGRAQLAAAVGILGDTARADRAFTSAVAKLKDTSDERINSGRGDFGSPLRDASAILTLAADTRARPALISSLSQILLSEKSKIRDYSTQEMSWMALAAGALSQNSKKVVLNINGDQRSGIFNALFSEHDLAEGISVINEGNETIKAALTVTGSPRLAKPAGHNGLILSREYFTLDGTPVDISKVEHNKRFVAVLTVASENQQPEQGNYLLEDRLPAGFEIENPNLIASGSTSNLAWLGELTTPSYTEFRDDRFVGSFKTSNFKVAYMMRAVTPGQYVHPGATVEDMYRRDQNARTSAGLVTIAVP